MSRKLTQEIQQELVDNTTGEVITKLTQKTYTASNEPNYIKLYIDDLMRLKDLPKSTNGFFMAILKTMDYENKVYITKHVRQQIIKNMGIGESTLRRLLDNCIKKGLMTKIDSNTFFLNPNIFGRGTWQNVKEIRMLVSYSSKGRLLLNYEEYDKRKSIPNMFDEYEK